MYATNRAMANPLPPYSTFRTDNKQLMYPQAIAHGNILAFTPPGFNQTIQVKFPDKRLAVCGKCKKNYKTREACRERNAHTGEPWQQHYICITLDESCLDETGTQYVNKPLTVRMVQWQPFCVKEAFGKDPDGKSVPVCSSCKKTNRTRSFCRDRHQHRQLPWCTVYVILSAVDMTDPSTIVAGHSVPVDASSFDTNDDGDDEKKSPTSPVELDPRAARMARANAEARAESAKIKVADDCDDINVIPESRTFLAMVSAREISIKWVELADYDPNSLSPENNVQALNASIRNANQQGVAAAATVAAAAAGASPAAGVQMRPPQNMQEYFAQLAAMGYTPQQQQQAWVMHQQYYQQQLAQAAAASGQQQLQAQAIAGQQQLLQAQQQQAALAQQQQQLAAGQYAGTQGWGQFSPAPAAVDSPSPASPTPAPAGEAAAPKQRESHNDEGHQESPSTQEQDHQEEDDQEGHEHDQQIVDPQAQWQAQMMYQQQLYQQQIQMQHEQGQSLDGHHQHHQHQHLDDHPGAPADVEPNPLSGVPNEPTAEDFDGVGVHLRDESDDELHHHHDAKRQRIDAGSAV